MLFFTFYYMRGLFTLFSLTMNNPLFFPINFSSGGKSKCYLQIHTALKLKIRKTNLHWEGNFCRIPSLLYAVLKNIAFIEIFILNCEIMTKREKQRRSQKMTLPTNTIKVSF